MSSNEINDSGLETVVVFAAEQYQMIMNISALRCDILIFFIELKLREKFPKKANFNNWKLLKTGNAIEKDMLYSTCNMR